MEQKYKIAEIFESIQGEGGWQGKWCLFVRFAGCNLHCAFCDTNHKVRMEIQETVLVESLRGLHPKYIVLTGGEPMLQITPSLVRKLRRLPSYPDIAIETNGTIWNEALYYVDYIAVSPKADGVLATEIKYNKVDELRLVCTADGLVTPKVTDFFRNIQQVTISPVFDKDGKINKTALNRALLLVEKHPDVMRLSVQLHKLIGVQ